MVNTCEMTDSLVKSNIKFKNKAQGHTTCVRACVRAYFDRDCGVVVLSKREPSPQTNDLLHYWQVKPFLYNWKLCALQVISLLHHHLLHAVKRIYRIIICLIAIRLLESSYFYLDYFTVWYRFTNMKMQAWMFLSTKKELLLDCWTPNQKCALSETTGNQNFEVVCYVLCE
jgi:hypothetical protein